MTATFSERFVVSTPDDLDELELALTEGGIASVVVDIPESATALLGAREFRRVVAAARNVGTRISFQTDDPLRRELARIVGARLAEPESSPVVADSVPKDDAPTRRIEPATVAVAPTEDDATFRLWEPGRQAGHWSEPDRTDASYSFVVTPPAPARTNVVVGELTTQTHDYWQTSIPRFEDWERIAPARHQSVRPSAVRRSRMVALALVTVTLLVIAGLLAAFVVPTATITVTPIVTPLSVDLTYGIAQPGTAWDIAIQPTTIESTLTFSATAPASGERFEPDAVAVGVLQLTNAATEDIVVPSGTTFVGDAGIEVVSTEEIVVPAADPFSSLMFGSATVGVRSTVPGPDGDIDSQAVFGQLDNGVFFVNREPVAGGTMKRIATVTQADHDALNQQARSDLTGRAASALDGKIPQGHQVVEGSQQQGTVVVMFDHAVGTDAQTTTIEASVRVTAQTFDPAAALQQARSEAERRITQSAGTDARPLPSSISIADPQPIDGSNGTAYALHASGSAEAILDATALDALRSDLTGAGQADALARVQQVPGVAQVAIERERAWIGNSLPRFASRISIYVRDSTITTDTDTAHAEGISAQATSSGSAPAGP